MRYYPEHLNVETSDFCNRSCTFCPIQHARDKRDAPRTMDIALFEKLLRELQSAPHPLKISLQWIDEPLANPRFFEMAALGRKMLPHAQWLLQTNGDMLTNERADELSRLFDAVVVNLYTEPAARRVKSLGLDVARATNARSIQSPGRL